MTEILTATEAAKLIRADIKAAVKDNTLGDYPDGVTFSVRRDYASLMSEITVTIKGAPERWALTHVATEFGGTRHDRTDAVKALARDLAAIVARHYEADRRHRFVNVNVQCGEDVWSVL